MSMANVKSINGAAAQGRPAGSAQHTQWRIDAAASRAEFTIHKRLFFVKHLDVTGRFPEITGTISLDEADPTGSHADVTITTSSVDTQQKRRDTHLRTAAFFHVEQFPTLTFTSRRIESIDAAAGRYKVIGDLTVRGVTKEVQLDATYAPIDHGAGQPRLRLTLSGPLNRRDFGMVWTSPVIKVADDLTVSLAIEATPA